MITRTLVLILTLGFAAIPPVPAVAHHASAGLFDGTRTIEVTGTVKEWRFVNPHPVLVLDVTDQSGARGEWDVYFGPAAVSFLRGRGYHVDSFRTGDALVVTGHPANTGSHAIDVFGPGTQVTRPDGTRVPK